MKILLVGLPVPNNGLSNLPLALGYLKASADAAGIPGLKVEILERQAQDRGGDAFLLDQILSYDPDMVGFSLYTWNSSRAIELARTLKMAAPEISTLGGGPEVNRDGDYILSAGDAFDFLVVGEGERTFVELLETLNSTTKSVLPLSLSKIKGLVFKMTEKGEWHFNAPRVAIEDVNLLPSVYLSGALEGFLGQFMMIELSRWCPSKCTFCYYGRQDLLPGGKRYFDLERVRQEIYFGLKQGVDQVHFVEANFNTLPHLDRLYKLIQETGANRSMRFYAEMRGEAINETEADNLAASNFSIVECGLQSAVPEVLARVKRKNNLPRLVRGVHLLRERGIEVFLDAILGLPGETQSTFQQTLSFIKDNNLDPYDLFHLQILPGTQLKAEASRGQHGLVWQKAPPYFALQTSELGFEQLCELRRDTLTIKGDDPSEVQGLPLPGPFSLVEPSFLTQIPQLLVPVDRVVLDRESLDSHSFLSSTARKLANEVTIWLKLDQPSATMLERAAFALKILSDPNPTGVWHIFIDATCPLTSAQKRELSRSVCHKEGYLDRLAVFALNEQNPENFEMPPSVSLYDIVQFPGYSGSEKPKFPTCSTRTVWRVKLDPLETVEQWSNQLGAAEEEPGYGIHLNFNGPVSLAKIKALVARVSHLKKEIFFSNFIFAAGFSFQPENSKTLFFPNTLGVNKNIPQVEYFGQADLERAVLSWELTNRLDRA